MIELSGLIRTFQMGGRPLHVLKSLDLVVEAGEYLAIMGPSGSGKSTLLNILGCLDTPTGGSYRLDGEEVGHLDAAELARVRMYKIGFVFQSFHLIGRLSALDNVKVPLMLAGIAGGEMEHRAREAVAAVGLAQRADHRPDQLSGGEKQRIAIARALIMNPPLILADEPTGNLDTQSGNGIVSLLEDLNQQGKTLVMVTHDPELGERAGRLLRIVDGSFTMDRKRT